MKHRPGLWALAVLTPSIMLFAPSAKADLITPSASDPWVLDDNCPADGLLPGEARCFSKRWFPESESLARHARARARRAAGPDAAGCDGVKLTAYSPTKTPGSMGADDLTTAYRLPSEAIGAGKIIALVDACGYTNLLSDLNAYRATYGIPAISECGGAAGVAPTKGGAQCIGIVSQTGTSKLPADDSNWSGETALDVQMASAACPECSLLVVQAKNATTLTTAIAEAVKLGADGVSNSWGSSESGSDAQLPTYTGTLITAASGDNDYLNQIGAVNEDAGTVDLSPGTINWPASDPNVLGVGGTTLTMDGTSNRCYTDSAWSYEIPTTSTSPLAGKTVYGGGSGCSIDYPKPSYQTSLDMGKCTMRGSVDVSAAADFSVGTYSSSICVKGQVCGGIAVYGGGGWNPSVGTSAATPFVTAALVRAGLAANANAYFYTNATKFIDVLTGNNDPSGTCQYPTLCNAGTGWDGPTGIGVPNVYELAVLGGASGVTAPPTPTCVVPLADAGGGHGGGTDASVPSGDSGTGTGGGSEDSGTTPPTSDDSGTTSPSDDAGTVTSNDDGGATTGPAGGSTEDGGAANGASGSSSGGGCGCTVGPESSSAFAWLGAFGAVLALGLRRRRHSA